MIPALPTFRLSSLESNATSLFDSILSSFNSMRNLQSNFPEELSRELKLRINSIFPILCNGKLVSLSFLRIE